MIFLSYVILVFNHLYELTQSQTISSLSLTGYVLRGQLSAKHLTNENLMTIIWFQTHLTFGKEFTAAVELKQVAQQEAERARFLVEKAEQVKKAAVISAEGDSQAASLLAKSFGDSGEALVELRRLEAAEDIANLLSRSRNVVYLPSGQNTLLSLPQM